MWQTPFSDAVRNSVHIPTITAGYIQDIDQINTILLNGRADLVALGRPLLADANFVRNAQAYEQFEAADIPNPYKAGSSHLYPLKAAERKQTESMKKTLKPKKKRYFFISIFPKDLNFQITNIANWPMRFCTSVSSI